MYQKPQREDYVIATGERHSVREFVERAFGQCRYGPSGTTHVETDPNLYRPAEVPLLVGDPATAKRELNWQHQVSFGELVAEMVESDCRAVGVRINRSAAG